MKLLRCMKQTVSLCAGFSYIVVIPHILGHACKTRYFQLPKHPAASDLQVRRSLCSAVTLAEPLLILAMTTKMAA